MIVATLTYRNDGPRALFWIFSRDNYSSDPSVIFFRTSTPTNWKLDKLVHNLFAIVAKFMLLVCKNEYYNDESIFDVYSLFIHLVYIYLSKSFLYVP